MIPGIQIKRATPADAALLADLSVITFIETYRGSCSDEDMETFMDKCFTVDGIAEELKDAGDMYFIALSDGFPAGYMRLKEEDSEYPLTKKYRAIQLKRIYVLKEFQSKKIGSALISFALRFASEKKYELMWLGVWEGNTKAKDFYEKMGFTDINQPYTFQIGNTEQTDWWMTKFLIA